MTNSKREEKLKATYEIDGYGVVLAHVQNYYAVEKIRVGWQWGFKYQSGVFEFFPYKTKGQAQYDRAKFVDALEQYYRRDKK